MLLHTLAHISSHLNFLKLFIFIAGIDAKSDFSKLTDELENDFTNTSNGEIKASFPDDPAS